MGWPALALFAIGGSLAGALLPVHEALTTFAASLYAVALTGTACLWGWFTGWRFAGGWLAACMLFWVWCSASWQPVLPPEVAGSDLRLTGYVASFPVAADGITRFDFLVAAVLPAAEPAMSAVGPALTGSRLKLSWYNPVALPEPGARWQLEVRLREPRGLANPGGFDYRRAMYLQGVPAVGYVRSSSFNGALPAVRSGKPWAIVLLECRAVVAAAIEHALPADAHSLPLLLALAVGARHLLTDSDWRVMRQTGTSHLLAISGLHITLAAGFGFLLGRLALLAAAAVWVPWASALLLGGIYAALSGFGLPATRALLMLLLYTLLLLGRRHYSGFELLGIAAIGALLLVPFAAWQAGFWLSFSAVAVLIHASRLLAGEQQAAPPIRLGWRNFLALGHSALRLQFTLVAALALPGAFFFGELSLLAPFVNLLAIPLFSFVVVPLLLLALLLLPVAPVIAGWLLSLLNVCLHTGFVWLTELAELRFATVPLFDAGVPVFLCGGLAVFLLLAPTGIPGRGCAVFLLVPVFFGLRSPLSDELFIDVLDVGHGLAVVIRAGPHTLLFDTGPAWRGGDAGASVLLPALRSFGVATADRLIISHSDSDHAGGLSSLQSEWPELSPYTCEVGNSWAWSWPGSSGAAVFSVLHPEPANRWSDNNGSCVLQIDYAGSRILLPGDIEAPAEAALISANRLGKADLVLLPHHGSLTSSTPDFVAAVAPRFAVASVAWRNRWGFPKSRVVARWRDAGACVLSTGDTGALRFIAGSAGLRLVRVWRERHWWQQWVWLAQDRASSKPAKQCL
jgi:competence protein ComEC